MYNNQVVTVDTLLSLFVDNIDIAPALKLAKDAIDENDIELFVDKSNKLFRYLIDNFNADSINIKNFKKFYYGDQSHDFDLSEIENMIPAIIIRDFCKSTYTKPRKKAYKTLLKNKSNMILMFDKYDNVLIESIVN